MNCLISLPLRLGWLCAGLVLASSAAPAALQVREFLPGAPLCRAQRPSVIQVVLENSGQQAVEAKLGLSAPAGVAILQGQSRSVKVEANDSAKVQWLVQAERAGAAKFQLEVVAPGTNAVSRSALTVDFLAPEPLRKLAYIPEPQPVQTSILVGAHNCPLWEADKPNMWDNVRKHPERTPALGFYAQENPEVADWETKWAVEHGVSFFIYCWYRTAQGGAVKQRYGSAIHDALFKSRFANRMKFTIMWENQSHGQAGVADEQDLMNNLLPYWLENYFKHPSYLKVDNQPVLFIYRPEFLIQDLGGEAKVVRAFGLMRQAARQAGFGGLLILGEYRGLDEKHLQLMKRLGLDYTFAYCWPIPKNPTPDQAVAVQMEKLRETQKLGILPQVPTVSQAWSGWRDEGSIWKIPPPQFENLLRQAKDFMGTLPANELGHRMLLLDNWNEWGEGHYLAPYREFGFGYLDAVRRVFANASEPHQDLIPEDIGLGPYDRAYWRQMEEAEKLRKMGAKYVVKTGAPAPGLVGWWAFDEPTNTPVAFDYSGLCRGGNAPTVKRAPGKDGNAIVCDGAAVRVSPQPLVVLTNALTIECWVKTDVANQNNKWFMNCIHGGGLNTGFRFGMVGGKPVFGLPLTGWSHHLAGHKPLPLGRWVHLAATFDGQVIRLYMDGEEQGTMSRPGRIKQNDFPLSLGNFDANHSAHFEGLLDEVKIYNRVLSPEEIRAECAR